MDNTTEQEHLEASRKLREGIVANLKQKITLHSVRSGYGVFNITSLEDIADSLLRDLPIPLFIDTGEPKNPYHKTGDFGHGSESWNEEPEFETFDEGVQAARAKFVSIGEIVKEDK